VKIQGCAATVKVRKLYLAPLSGVFPRTGNIDLLGNPEGRDKQEGFLMQTFNKTKFRLLLVITMVFVFIFNILLVWFLTNR